MSKMPSWLPDMFAVTGDWQQDLANLYAIFVKDWKMGKPTVGKIRVWWDRTIQPGDKFENGFWHLIERKQKETGERGFDSWRAERLPWSAPILKNYTDASMLYWRYEEEKKKIHIYVWLKDFDYVIILHERQKKVGLVGFLVTAFHVDGDSKRNNLQVKYEKRIV